MLFPGNLQKVNNGSEAKNLFAEFNTDWYGEIDTFLSSVHARLILGYQCEIKYRVVCGSRSG